MHPQINAKCFDYFFVVDISLGLCFSLMVEAGAGGLAAPL
jgi:hypothetical protein